MTTSKQLWVLAGGNGAGKSTFFRNNLAGLGMLYVSADQIAKDLYAEDTDITDYKVATLAAQLRDSMLQQGKSFCYETVFSHVSKIDFIGEAIALGYEVILVYIHLESSDLNEARVYQRIAEGGHSVPIDKIHSRIPRTMQYIAKTLPMVSEARLLDNSFRGDPFKQVAVVKKGSLDCTVDELPDWAKTILEKIVKTDQE
jgi:predicted ABC-type ATPase